MLRKRIIFTLIYENGFFNQSRNFRLQKVGNIEWLEKNYKFKEISFSLDELVVLDASKSTKNIEQFSEILARIVDDVFIPISAGGGIKSIDDAQLLFESGADKIVVNTLLSENIKLVKKLIDKYGSQSVVGAVDYQGDNVYIKDGRVKIEIDLKTHLKNLESLGIGEIYLNSIERDGTGFGYDLDTINQVSKNMNLPLIIAGGAGNEKHLMNGLKIDSVDAVATANLFNFIGDGLSRARNNLLKTNENIAKWR